MAADNPETDAFLAIIETKIAALQTLADSYRAALSVGALGQASEGGDAFQASANQSRQRTGGAPDLPKGAFRGMGIAEAIRAYLGAAKAKQGHKAIVTALQEGGVASTSDDFEKMVVSTLHRLRHRGELLQFKDGWDLSDGYSDSFRQRLKEAAPKPKTVRKTLKARVAKRAKAADVPEQPQLKAV
jgi:hypothetical protein